MHFHKNKTYFICFGIFRSWAVSLVYTELTKKYLPCILKYQKHSSKNSIAFSQILPTCWLYASSKFSLWRDSRMLASTWRIFLRQLILLHVIFMSWTPSVCILKSHCRNPPYKRHWSISNPLRVAWAGNPQTNNIHSALTSCFNLPFQLKSSINYRVHKNFLNASHLNLSEMLTPSTGSDFLLSWQCAQFHWKKKAVTCF